MLNLHHLRLFRAVAVDGTLTGAARTLNLSQSALSVQIRTLEEALQQQLFERRGRGLVLTEAGRIALDHAETIFRTADELTATLRGGQLRKNVIRIGALGTLSRNFQLSFVQPLMNTADIEVVLRSGSQAELLQGLNALALDVVLTNLAPARDAASPYLVHRMAEQPVSLIGPPSRQSAGMRSLAEWLASEPLVLPTLETPMRTAFDSLIAKLDVTPQIAAEADDMAMLRLLAREHDGLTVIPSIVVRDELAAELLIEIATLPDLTETFYAVMLQRQFPNPLIRQLLTAK